MIIEIFEAKGFSEPDTNLDATIVNIRKRHGDRITIKKIDVLDKSLMKGHRDVMNNIKTSGLEGLPIVKLDKKIVKYDRISSLMR